MKLYISVSNLPLQRVLPVATTICGGFQRRTQRPAAAPSSRGIADLAVESATESKDRVSVSRANLPLLPESSLPTATLSASQSSNSLSRRQRACVGITVPRLRIRSSLACASKVTTLVRKERPRVAIKTDTHPSPIIFPINRLHKHIKRRMIGCKLTIGAVAALSATLVCASPV